MINAQVGSVLTWKSDIGNWILMISALIEGLRSSDARVKFLLGYHEGPWSGAISATLRPFGRACSFGHPALLLGQLPCSGSFPRSRLG